jgi:hypothetical protein
MVNGLRAPKHAHGSSRQSLARSANRELRSDTACRSWTLDS